jgi:hypothetical protein
VDFILQEVSLLIAMFLKIDFLSWIWLEMQ